MVSPDAFAAPDFVRFGAFVRTRRRELRLSMLDLATRAGLGRTTVHRLEHGYRRLGDSRVAVPHPCTAAGVLLTLAVDAADVGRVAGETEWTAAVVRWMALLEAASSTHDAAAVAALVKRRRRATGQTMDEFCRGAGLDEGTMWSVEKGHTHNQPGGSGDRQRRPGAGDLARILGALKITAAEVRALLGSGRWAAEVTEAMAASSVTADGADR